MTRTLHIIDTLHSSHPNNGRFYTVAIDGRGASGKSALAARLARVLPDFVIVNGDDYFEPVQDKIVWGAFNDERLKREVIEQLRTGSTFVHRPYDWHTEPPVTETQVTIVSGFCLERCFSFTFDLDWDLKLWVETPRTLCLERGVARDSQDLPPDRALGAWRDVWQPTEDEYIHKQRPHEIANFILDGTKDFDSQVAA